MTETLKQDEAVPASYPATPSGLSAAAAALNASVIWSRIEAFTSIRWTSRVVIWTVEGPGEWVPILTPATISVKEKWTGTAWVTDAPDASALGGYQLADAVYRFAATVGAGPVPEAANEAYRRLAEYMAATQEAPGSTSESYNLGSITVSTSRNPAWMARAIINSGAADLLRPYRRAA